MPDPGNPISSLYAPPPNLAPQGVLAGNPLAAAGQLLQIQSMQGQRAAGGAMLKGLNPDGTFNPANAVSAAQADPNAAWAGSQFTHDVIANRAANSQAAIAAIGAYDAGRGSVAAYIGSFNPDNLDPDTVHTIQTNAARIPGADPNALGNLNTPQKMAKAIKAARAYNNPGATVAPTTATPSVEGAPTVGNQADLASGGVRTVGLSPQQAADTTEYQGDQTASANISKGLRPVQNALPLIEKLNDVTNFGVGSKQFTKLKTALVNTGVISPDTTDAAVRQEAGKYLLQSVTQAAGAGRSDEALNATLGSNPNPDTMLKPAVIATIKNKIAMDRQDAALPAAARSELGFGAKDLPQGYKTYKGGYYNNTDVRAFGFDLMSPQERAQLLKSLGHPGSPSFKRFQYSLDLAQKVGGLHSQTDLNSLVPTTQSGGAQ